MTAEETAYQRGFWFGSHDLVEVLSSCATNMRVNAVDSLRRERVKKDRDKKIASISPLDCLTTNEQEESKWLAYDIIDRSVSITLCSLCHILTCSPY